MFVSNVMEVKPLKTTNKLSGRERSTTPRNVRRISHQWRWAISTFARTNNNKNTIPFPHSIDSRFPADLPGVYFYCHSESIFIYCLPHGTAQLYAYVMWCCAFAMRACIASVNLNLLLSVNRFVGACGPIGTCYGCVYQGIILFNSAALSTSINKIKRIKWVWVCEWVFWLV